MDAAGTQARRLSCGQQSVGRKLVEVAARTRRQAARKSGRSAPRGVRVWVRHRNAPGGIYQTALLDSKVNHLSRAQLPQPQPAAHESDIGQSRAGACDYLYHSRPCRFIYSSERRGAYIKATHPGAGPTGTSDEVGDRPGRGATVCRPRAVAANVVRQSCPDALQWGTMTHHGVRRNTLNTTVCVAGGPSQ